MGLPVSHDLADCRQNRSTNGEQTNDHTIGDLGGGGGMSVIVHGSEELPNPDEQPDARTAAEVTIIAVISSWIMAAA